jgi:hypothetical protein
VVIDDQNRFFRVFGDFVPDFALRYLVGYFGKETALEISESIERVDAGCFAFCEHLGEIRFGIGGKMSTFGASAFEGCSSLRSICIPSSIAGIRKGSPLRLSSLIFPGDTWLWCPPPKD